MTNIYFIYDGENIKIGKSENISKRLTELQVGSSTPLKALFFIPNVDECFETHMHGICSRFNIRGEWFSKNVIKFLVKHPWFKENIKVYES